MTQQSQIINASHKLTI